MQNKTKNHYQSRVKYWEGQVARTDKKMNPENMTASKHFLLRARTAVDIEVLQIEEEKSKQKPEEEEEDNEN